MRKITEEATRLRNTNTQTAQDARVKRITKIRGVQFKRNAQRGAAETKKLDKFWQAGTISIVASAEKAAAEVQKKYKNHLDFVQCMVDECNNEFSGIENEFLSYKTIREKKAAIQQAMLDYKKQWKSFRFFRSANQKTFEDVLPGLNESL